MVAGIVSATGASRRLLVAILDGDVRMLLSTSMLVEYEAVLTRPSVLSMAGVDAADVLDLLDELAGICSPVTLDVRWRPLANDADDDFVLEAAINGIADVIVSFNTKHMLAGALAFGIPVVRPHVVLRRIEQ